MMAWTLEEHIAWLRKQVQYYQKAYEDTVASRIAEQKRENKAAQQLLHYQAELKRYVAHWEASGEAERIAQMLIGAQESTYYS